MAFSAEEVVGIGIPRQPPHDLLPRDKSMLCYHYDMMCITVIVQHVFPCRVLKLNLKPNQLNCRRNASKIPANFHMYPL